jgi:glycosyltransferase involved in cell wall biosynthesis
MLRGVEKWAALHAAEVFALPSHQENFGIAVAEALACRVPVLISRAVNIWREIDGATAGLVAPDTLAGTTDLLRRWQALADSEREAMRQNARACFIQNFSIEQSAARLMDLLEENQPAHPTADKSAERASLGAETPSG